MRGYGSRDVANLLDLSVGQVRAYARAGFLTPTRGPRGEYRFSFQDLVLLRTARDLVAARVPAARIRRALARLREQLPTGRPLSALRIAAEGGNVVVRDGDAVWNPESGQLHIDFTVAELAGRAAPLARQAMEDARAESAYDAEDWYDLGLELEAVTPDEAMEAYRRALALDPRHADAHVNLGRLMHEQGSVIEAEVHYRQALAAAPRHATAAFNLGVALEDLGRLDAALAAYRRAADADLADAHYNLARLHERLGHSAAAIRHLKSYRALLLEAE